MLVVGLLEGEMVIESALSKNPVGLYVPLLG
jgi:hypothetical protein